MMQHVMNRYPKTLPLAEVQELITNWRNGSLWGDSKEVTIEHAWWIQGYIQSVIFKIKKDEESDNIPLKSSEKVGIDETFHRVEAYLQVKKGIFDDIDWNFMYLLLDLVKEILDAGLFNRED